jgi:hypothetical protein
MLDYATTTTYKDVKADNSPKLDGIVPIKFG